MSLKYHTGEIMKHELGEIWKVGRVWNIQMPKGIMTTDTKGRAKLFSRSAVEGSEFTLTGAIKRYDNEARSK